MMAGVIEKLCMLSILCGLTMCLIPEGGVKRVMCVLCTLILASTVLTAVKDFDFDSYALRKSIDSGEDIRIYTPLQVYRRLGSAYGRVGVMAANNLSAHGIEEALMAANPDIYMIGTGNMAIVRAIEDEMPPEEIVDKCGIADLLKYFEACGAEALVLGCTHFPYFKEELEKLTSLPIIDPADEMFEALLKATR